MHLTKQREEIKVVTCTDPVQQALVLLGDGGTGSGRSRVVGVCAMGTQPGS